MHLRAAHALAVMRLVPFGAVVVALQAAVAVLPAVQAGGQSRLLEEANASYLAQRPHDAVRLYRQYLVSYPDRADVRVYLGAALFGLGEPEQSLKEAKRALELDDRYGRAYVLIGRIYASRNGWAIAQQAFSDAIRLDPRDREAWYFSGRAFYEENRFEKAIAAFQKARSLGSEQSRIYENLGLAYEALIRNDEAEQAYRRAVELAGSEYRPCFAYGVFLHKQGKLAQSVEMLKKALALNPESAETHFELGRALYHAGQLDSAAGVLEQALINSNECRLHYLLVSIYSQQHREEDAGRQAKAMEGCRREP